jgi:small-conductance mechanosensitive channel
MSSEMNLVWEELFADISTAVIAWQLIVIVASLLLAWSINGLLRAYVMRYAPENWKVGIGGINRVLFPLSSLLFVFIGKLVLGQWQHTSMLKLATTLLLAMAAIRLMVYALRYIFAPSGWVRATESAIATTIWMILALHLSGLLPELTNTLAEISFNIGKHPVSLLLVIQALLTVLITLIAALWVSRALENKLMRAEQINMNVRVVLSKLLRIVLSLVAILLALSAIGFDITLLSVFGGALGVGLGFGLQKIASNYVSGFIILLDDSMHMGDVVTVDTHYGVVSELRSRYMVLRKLDDTEVVIPNETLITNAVINHSFTNRKTQVQMPVQVSYESPLEEAMELMQAAATQQARVLKTPAPEVKIKGFGESGIDLVLTAWIQDPEQGSGGLQSAIYLDIWRAFKKHSISIPYPQREVRILGSAGPSRTDQTKSSEDE